ncbi:hypothetical protein VPH35_071504 [Triticum aestivum]
MPPPAARPSLPVRFRRRPAAPPYQRAAGAGPPPLPPHALSPPAARPSLPAHHRHCVCCRPAPPSQPPPSTSPATSFHQLAATHTRVRAPLPTPRSARRRPSLKSRIAGHPQIPAPPVVASLPHATRGCRREPRVEIVPLSSTTARSVVGHQKGCLQGTLDPFNNPVAGVLVRAQRPSYWFTHHCCRSFSDLR